MEHLVLELEVFELYDLIVSFYVCHVTCSMFDVVSNPQPFYRHIAIRELSNSFNTHENNQNIHAVVFQTA